MLVHKTVMCAVISGFLDLMLQSNIYQMCTVCQAGSIVHLASSSLSALTTLYVCWVKCELYNSPIDILVFNLFLKKDNHALVVVQCHISSLGWIKVMNSFVSVQILFLFKIIFQDYKCVTSLFSFFPPPHFMHPIPLLSLKFNSARIVVGFLCTSSAEW